MDRPDLVRAGGLREGFQGSRPAKRTQDWVPLRVFRAPDQATDAQISETPKVARRAGPAHLLKPFWYTKAELPFQRLRDEDRRSVFQPGAKYLYAHR